MESIYQKLWDADMLGNGLPALRVGESTNESTGYVLVDEPQGLVDADHEVIKAVSIPESKQETYRLCERLFDNYAMERRAVEIVRPQETQEEMDFIDAIMRTRVIQVAKRYIGMSINRRISDQNFASLIKQTWFRYATSGSQRQATGFEHVFVGEQGSKVESIGGYHFWYKYYLDEGGKNTDNQAGRDRIRYYGTRYGGGRHADRGLLIPEIVTLSLSFDAPSGDTRRRQSGDIRLSKPVGGFFVGCSPEGLIALGMVRCLTQSGKIAKINGAEYQLDLHRMDDNPVSIRTFFPRFLRADFIDIRIPSQPRPTPKPSEPSKSEPTIPDAKTDPATQPPDIVDNPEFRVIAAMVNPKNPEGGQEFVQIMNISSEVANLEGWNLIAPNGVEFTLGDVEVEPGELHQFRFPTKQSVLRNKLGTISLTDPHDNLAQVCEYSSEAAAREGAPILF